MRLCQLGYRPTTRAGEDSNLHIARNAYQLDRELQVVLHSQHSMRPGRTSRQRRLQPHARVFFPDQRPTQDVLFVLLQQERADGQPL